MNTWNPYFVVGGVVFAGYVLIAIFGSRDRKQHGEKKWKS